MDPRAAVSNGNGIAQEHRGQGVSTGNELQRRLQARYRIAEGLSHRSTEPPRERATIGNPAPSATSTGQSVSTSSTVFVPRAQPRSQQTFFRQGNYHNPTPSGSSSPACPWPAPYAASGALPTREVHRGGYDPLSRSAPSSGPAVATLSSVAANALKATLMERVEGMSQLNRQLTEEVSELSGAKDELAAMQKAFAEAENSGRRQEDIRMAFEQERHELITTHRKALSEAIDACRQEYNENFETERVQMLSAQQQLMAENSNMLQRERFHFEQEEKMHAEHFDMQQRERIQEEKEQKLLLEKSELASASRRARSMSEGEADRWRVEAESLRREKHAWQAQKDALEASHAKLREDFERVAAENKALSSLSNVSCSGCRLRAVITKQSATIEELKSSIAGVDGLLSEARRELSGKEFREKRAATEQLHKAMSVEHRLDEDGLASSIDFAKRAGVAEEDITKAEGFLADLRAMTPEECQRRVNDRLERYKKEEAFVCTKRDRVADLEALLDSLEEGVAWEKWHDSQGRTLLKFAQQLVSQGAIKVLEERIEQRHPGSLKKEPAHRRGSLLHNHHPPHRERGINGLAMGRTSSGDGMQDEAFASLGDVAGVQADGSQASDSRRPSKTNLLVDAPAAPWAAVAPTPLPLSPAGSAAPTSTVADASGAVEVAAASEAAAPAASSSSSALAGGPTAGDVAVERADRAKEMQLKKEAFRCCARGEVERLAEVLAQVPLDMWTKWRNGADKDLQELCVERGAGSEECLKVIFEAMGLTQEREREYFEEGTYVWVHRRGEVQAMQATVKQDTPEEDDLILIEYWIGSGAPEYVDRGIVSRMPER
mmetsp:Transcript_18888/g.61447  ORF Transcript_18888/g.61447 Transcript_18888/m.61447 type:complete len:834 (+) Transcript_18888:103-2604(+)